MSLIKSIHRLKQVDYLELHLSLPAVCRFQEVPHGKFKGNERTGSGYLFLTTFKKLSLREGLFFIGIYSKKTQGGKRNKTRMLSLP